MHKSNMVPHFLTYVCFIYSLKGMKNTSDSSYYNAEDRDGIKSKGDKIRMPCTHSTVI